MLGICWKLMECSSFLWNLQESWCRALDVPVEKPGPCLNIKTVFPRYGDSHVKGKTVARSSHLKNGDPYIGKTSLYWDGPQVSLIYFTHWYLRSCLTHGSIPRSQSFKCRSDQNLRISFHSCGTNCDLICFQINHNIHIYFLSPTSQPADILLSHMVFAWPSFHN